MGITARRRATRFLSPAALMGWLAAGPAPAVPCKVDEFLGGAHVGLDDRGQVFGVVPGTSPSTRAFAFDSLARGRRRA